MQRGNSNDFVFTCNIKEEVAKEMDGYGKNWTTPVLYKVEYSYLTQKGLSETKIMESDQLSVFTTAIGETKPTKHTTLLTNANNFIENKSLKEIVKMW